MSGEFSYPSPKTQPVMTNEGHYCEAAKIKLDRTGETKAKYENVFHLSTSKAVRNELIKSVHFLNTHLFNGELPVVVVTTDYSGTSKLGYFAPNRFVINSKHVDQISINPLFILHQSQEQVLQTLAHEMTHHFIFRRTSERPVAGYHSMLWANKMESIGLIASHTGKPGGKKTGKKMSDYPKPGGRFEQVIAEMMNAGFGIRWRAAVNEMRRNILMNSVPNS